MRLIRLHIEEFKNLRNLTVNFSHNSTFSIVVGRNGTGKSNVIEALVLIFKSLDLKTDTSFKFWILYECADQPVFIDHMGSKRQYYVGLKGKLIETSDKQAQWDELVSLDINEYPKNLRALTKTKFYEKTPAGHYKYLPAHVFGYYSGPSNRLKDHFDNHQKRFYNDLLKGKAGKIIRPLFYARNVHSQFVLLAFFSGLDDVQGNFLKNYLNIESFDSALFVLNAPPWSNRSPFKEYGWFWNAKGVVGPFLRSAHRFSLAPVQQNVRINLDFNKSTRKDHYYLFVPNESSLQEIASSYKSQHEFFSALESTYVSKLLKEVRVRVKVSGQTLSFRELSEGEQQLLMVLGLLKFTQREEALFLLDEPDTHLNPAWSIEYIDLLKQIVEGGEKSHFVISTHDPLVIAGRTKEEVVLLSREQETITASMPAEDPRGMGVAALLTSELYGLRSELDLETLRMFEQFRRLKLTAQDRALSEKENESLEILRKNLSGLKIEETWGDPYYPRFVRAMAQRQGKQVGTETSEEWLESQKLASEILDDLLESE